MLKNTLLLLSIIVLLSFSGCTSCEKSTSSDQTKEQVTFKGTPMKLKGHMVSVGDTAPKAVVVTKDLVEKTVGGMSNKTQVLIVVPSIDTPVCNLEARTFNEKVASMKDVDFTIISMDLPFALGRFCEAEGIKNLTMASDFRYKAMGENYGVSIKTALLRDILARAIFVIKNGKVVYKQLVKEIATEPDYEKALKAI